MTDQFVTANWRVAMADLSPQAQAVLDAFGAYPLRADHIGEDLIPALAAALRAAGEQIENRYCDTDESSLDDSPGIVFAMRQLVLIAAELEWKA